MEVKIRYFLSTLFRNKDFISQESSILADVENIIFHWIRIRKSLDRKLKNLISIFHPVLLQFYDSFYNDLITDKVMAT